MDTIKYWMERGPVYYDQHRRLNPISKSRFYLQERAIINQLYNYYPFESVLEVGCGYGRITSLILDNLSISKSLKRYVAIDISLDQINKAQERTREKGNVEYRQIAIQDLDYENEFDLVIASEVLMHVPPDQIRGAIDKLISASKGLILNVDWCAPKEPREAGGYCFQHNYEALYGDAFIKSVPIWPSRLLRQSIFVAR